MSIDYGLERGLRLAFFLCNIYYICRPLIATVGREE